MTLLASVSTSALQLEVEVKGRQRGVSSVMDMACSRCGRQLHDVGILRLTLFDGRDIEVTIRICEGCLREAGVADMLREGGAA